MYLHGFIVNIGQKVHGAKFSPTKPGGKIGENFLLAKNFWLYSIFIIHGVSHCRALNNQQSKVKFTPPWGCMPE